MSKKDQDEKPPGAPPVPTPSSRPPAPAPPSRPPVPTPPARPPVSTPLSRPPVPSAVGGPTVPPPPRRPRTSVHTTGTPGELTTSSVTPPPTVVKRPASDTVDTDTVEQKTIRRTGPSTSAQGTQSSPRASKAKMTTSTKSPPRASDKGEQPSTSGDTKTEGVKGKLTQRLFGKRKSETRGEPAPEPSPQNQPGRRPSIVNAQNKAKTTRILYTTDEEVRDALIEFTVFIVFLILTSLVTLSVRHSYMFYFNDTMKKLFTTRDLVIAPSVTVNFERQITVPDWWDYLVYNFLVTLHGDLTIVDRGTNKTGTDQETTPRPAPTDDIRSNEETYFENRIDNHAQSKDGYYWDPGPDMKTGAREIRKTIPEPPTPVPDRQTRTKHNISNHHLEGRVFLYENLLLGPPRLRQIRVKKESCYVNDAFIRYFNSCYAAYSRGSEDMADFQGIQYQTMKSLHSMPLWTVLAYYRTGGYVIDLTYEKDENLAIVTNLKNNHWLDRGSRLCLVEFNLFNDNTDIFQSVKLIAEIPPTGGVIPQAQFQTVKQHSFFTDRSMAMLVVYIFWYIMVVYYTIYEINEVRKSGCKNYIFSIMNVLDCIILLLCYLALGYNIWHTLKISSVSTKAMAELTYQSLDVLCFWNIIYVDMMAILAFLVWIKIFKFISFNKTLVQFTTTLKRCSKDLAGFSLMFGIVFLAYAQLGLLLFGTKHPDFRNFITSILTMIRMILGDFQYNLIEQANRVLGPIYFLTYILLVFFILLNMFLAIIMETYNTVKGEITQGRSQLGSYIYKKALGILYWIVHCGRKRRSQEPTAESQEQSKVIEEEPEVLQKNLTATE
ncbi:hypothetical protein KR032_008238 [Drosophila birchii]|nr:hypothetical protein KR032_008238 [Drosophila birchii]